MPEPRARLQRSSSSVVRAAIAQLKVTHAAVGTAEHSTREFVARPGDGGAPPRATTSAEAADATRSRRTPRVGTAIFVAALGFFLLTHGGHFYSADSMLVHLTGLHLVEQQRLDIGNAWGAVKGPDDLRYGRYGLGLSILQAPFAWLGKQIDVHDPGAFRRIVGPIVSIYYPENFSIFAATLVGPLCGALAAAMLWSVAGALGYPRRVRAALVLLLVLATQAWPASRDGFAHIGVLALLLVAIREALTWSRPIVSPAILGSALGFLLLLRPFDAVLGSPAILVYTLVRHARADRAAGVLARNLVAAAVPLVVAGVIAALHNHLRFGHVLLFDEPGTQSFNGTFLLGAYGLLLSSGRGLFFYSPPLIAGLCGVPAFARRLPAETALLAGIALPIFAGYAIYASWDGGLCWGPRYIVPLVPLLLLPAGELLAAGGAGAVLTLVLGAFGFVVQVIGTGVDFHRVAHEAGFTRETLYDPAKSPLLEHWRFFTAGRQLDWLALRIKAASGTAAMLAYLAVPTWLLIGGLWRLRSAWRAEASAALASGCADAPQR